MLNKKRLRWLYRRLETLSSAEGGTRTPMPFRAQRPERCVSTDFTTSAGGLWTGTILLYHLRVVKCFEAVFLGRFLSLPKKIMLTLTVPKDTSLVPLLDPISLYDPGVQQPGFHRSG